MYMYVYVHICINVNVHVSCDLKYEVCFGFSQFEKEHSPLLKDLLLCLKELMQDFRNEVNGE